MSPSPQADFAKMIDPRRIRQSQGFEVAVAPLVLEPAGLDELAEVVRRCERERITIAPIGACRTLRHLRYETVDAAISLARMAEVISHEPDDMTVVVGAGMTLGALEAVLARHGQHLPVDPPLPEQTTVGAMLGASQSGPLRHSAGAVRDFLTGVHFIGHDGRLVRGGGRVVKNVAGYDLMKLMIGSFGTLGIITEATFKVRPLPEVYAIGVSYHTRLPEAFEAGFRLHDALPLLHLELLSPGVNTPMARDGHYVLVAGAGGNRRDVNYELDQMHRMLGDIDVAEGGDAQQLYRAVRDVELPEAAVKMQIATVPREMPSCLEKFDVHFRAHVGSGVAQVAFNGGADAAALLRRAVAQARGNARVLALDPALRGAVSMFDQPAPGALKLMRALKAAFDPAAIFNPGCFVGGL